MWRALTADYFHLLRAGRGAANRANRERAPRAGQARPATDRQCPVWLGRCVQQERVYIRRTPSKARNCHAKRYEIRAFRFKRSARVHTPSRRGAPRRSERHGLALRCSALSRTHSAAPRGYNHQLIPFTKTGGKIPRKLYAKTEGIFPGFPTRHESGGCYFLTRWEQQRQQRVRATGADLLCLGVGDTTLSRWPKAEPLLLRALGGALLRSLHSFATPQPRGVAASAACKMHARGGRSPGAAWRPATPQRPAPPHSTYHRRCHSHDYDCAAELKPEARLKRPQRPA